MIRQLPVYYKLKGRRIQGKVSTHLPLLRQVTASLHNHSSLDLPFQPFLLFHVTAKCSYSWASNAAGIFFLVSSAWLE